MCWELLSFFVTYQSWGTLLRGCRLATTLNLIKQAAEKCFVFRQICNGKPLRDRKRASPFALLNKNLSYNVLDGL